MSVIKDSTYQLTTPTQAEVDAYKKAHRTFAAGVYFVTCKLDGKRFWYSGLGKGSHERSHQHNQAERAAWLATADGQRYQAQMRQWEAEQPAEAAAYVAKLGGDRPWEVMA